MHKKLDIKDIAIDLVKPNPYQPRKEFAKEALEELANSILTHGLLQPITVRKVGEYFELISGERRLRACGLAKLEKIPAIIIEVETEDSAILALIENLQRENLNFLEEARAYTTIMQDYQYTQQELAKTLGKNQSTVANKLRVLKLPQKIQQLLIDNHLTERHARALLKLPTEKDQMKVIKKVIKQELNVKKTEQLIEQLLGELTKKTILKHQENQKVQMYIKDMRLVTNTITEAVTLIQKAGINAKYTMKEQKDSYEIKIKIPINK